jgi:hypothetical protein
MKAAIKLLQKPFASKTMYTAANPSAAKEMRA